jgi:transposase-like protein
MTLFPRRCPSCNGKSIEAQRTYTIHCGEPRTLYHCAPCARSFSETRHTPIAQLKTPRDSKIIKKPREMVVQGRYPRTTSPRGAGV